MKLGEDGAAVKIVRRSKPINDFGNRKRKGILFAIAQKESKTRCYLSNSSHAKVAATVPSAAAVVSCLTGFFLQSPAIYMPSLTLESSPALPQIYLVNVFS